MQTIPITRRGGGRSSGVRNVGARYLYISEPSNRLSTAALNLWEDCPSRFDESFQPTDVIPSLEPIEDGVNSPISSNGIAISNFSSMHSMVSDGILSLKKTWSYPFVIILWWLMLP